MTAAFPHGRSAGTGRIVASVDDLIYEPRGWQRDGTRRGVVVAHGAGGSTQTFWSPTISPSQYALLSYLAGFYPCAVIEVGNSWGNATALSRMDSARTYLQGTLGAKSGGVYLLGLSMGGIAVARYTAADPSKVSAIAGIIPGFDLQQLRDSNASGYRTSIDAAWGVTYPAPLPAGGNPADNPTALAGIPYKAWTASDDPVWPPSYAAAFLAAINGIQVDVGALGHSEAAIAAVPPFDVYQFFATAAP